MELLTQGLRELIDEAKILGLRIKWSLTGRLILRALQSNNTLCFDTRPFKRGGADPQDCILYLEQLLEVLEKSAGSTSSVNKDKKRAFLALMANAETNAQAM